MESMEKKGVIFSKLYLPSRIKIEIQKLDDEKWILHYVESFNYDIPPKAMQFSVEAAKHLGVQAKKKGNTFFYKMEGSIGQMAGVIVGEFMQFTPIGNITLTEMLALAALGLPALRQSTDKKSYAKE